MEQKDKVLITAGIKVYFQKILKTKIIKNFNNFRIKIYKKGYEIIII